MVVICLRANINSMVNVFVDSFFPFLNTMFQETIYRGAAAANQNPPQVQQNIFANAPGQSILSVGDIRMLFCVLYRILMSVNELDERFRFGVLGFAIALDLYMVFNEKDHVLPYFGAYVSFCL